MARRSSSLITPTSVANVVNKYQNLRSIHENSAHDEQKTSFNIDRFRSLSGKVERCLQELIERICQRNSLLNFELLAPPATHLSLYLPNENKECYFDFYLVWKNSGNIQIERDQSSICCKIQYLDRIERWSRAEQARLLLTNITRKKLLYINGRGLRDLLFETLREIAPDLIRLDFLEHLIYFDLIIPSLAEKVVCHITLLPCLQLVKENEVLLPFGTLRWYPRSLSLTNEKSPSNLFQQPLQIPSIRRYISGGDAIDETIKISQKDQREYAYIRTIIHELLLPWTLEHIDDIEQIREPFESEKEVKFFLPHKLDRNCNVFPAGQYLLDHMKAKQFFREFLRLNVKVSQENQIIENIE